MAFESLVILGSTITALAVARDAHLHGLRPIVVDSEKGPAFFSRRAARVVVDATSSQQTLAALLSVSGPAAALISTSDHWLRFIIKHRIALDAAYGCLLHPRNEALQICLDKIRFSRWCAQQNLPTPLSWIGGEEPMPTGAKFPMLLRPAHTAHSRGGDTPKAIEVHSRSELDEWLFRFAELKVKPLVSESLLGRDLAQCSIAFARQGTETIVFAARKVRPGPERCSVGSCVELHVDPIAEELGRSAAAALDYFGVGELEILHDRSSNARYVIEINARPWLQYALAPASGHDFLGLLLGATSRRPVPQTKKGKTWIHLKDDLFNAFSRSVGSVRQGRLSVGEYAVSVSRSNVFAIFDPRDLAPFFNSLRPRN